MFNQLNRLLFQHHYFKKFHLCRLLRSFVEVKTLISKFLPSSYCSSNMIEKFAQFQWNMQSLLRLHLAPSKEYAFLLLNTPIYDPETTLRYWKNAAFRMAIDGGGNAIYDLLRKSKLDDNDEFLPHVVSGDFDSICSEVLSTYRNRKVKIIHTPDQDEPDFFKGLLEAVCQTEVSTFMVLCENGERFDHVMSNVNTLFKATKHSRTKHLKIFLLTSNTITWLLQPGNHILHIPSELWNDKSYCALIPVGQPCFHVTTTGLKWNLDDSILQFGGIVSSSNTYDIHHPEPVVTLKTDSHLIWSMSINQS